MKRRHYSSVGERSLGNQGRVVLVGLTGDATAPPELKPGQVSCRACRQATTLTTTGIYRSHRDLFGNPCGARSPQEIERLDVVPDVVIPNAPKENARVSPPVERAGVRAWGECQDCGALVSGERRYCGTCAMHRGRNRRRK